MKGIMKKIISALLVLIMLVSLVPTTVFAQTTSEEYPTYELYQADNYAKDEVINLFMINSYNHEYVELFKNNSGFQISVAGWELTNKIADPASWGNTEYLDKMEYYQLMIFDVINAATENSDILDILNNKYFSYIASVTKSAAKFLAESDYKQMVSEGRGLTPDVVAAINSGSDLCCLTQAVGNAATIVKYADSAADFIQKMARYQIVYELNQYQTNVLLSIRENTDDYYLQEAIDRLVSYQDAILGANMVRFLETTEFTLNVVYEISVNALWSAIIGPLGASLNLLVKGTKLAVNEWFGTDAIVEAYYAMKALDDFEVALKEVMANARNTYLSNKTADNAKFFLAAISMYEKTVLLSCDYIEDLLDAQYKKAAWNLLFGSEHEMLTMYSGLENYKNVVSGGYAEIETTCYTGYQQKYSLDEAEVLGYLNYTIETIPLTGVTCKDKEVTISVNESMYVITQSDPSNTTQAQYLYFSDNPDVVTIGSFGNITGISEGTATITVCAVADESISDTMTVTVSGVYDPLTGSKTYYDEDGNITSTQTDNRFTYTVSNNEATITGYTGNSSLVIVPSTIGGYPVKSIGKKAFVSNRIVKTVKLPPSVLSVGDYAFQNCINLTEVTLNEGLTYIGGRAFTNTAITEITIPKTVTTLYTFCDINRSFVYGASKLKKVIFAEGRTSIPKGALLGNTTITEVVIPDDVTSIGAEAFSGCTGLKDAYFMGTEKQWNTVSIGNDNSYLLNATIHFINEVPDEDITFSGASLTLHDNISINFKANESLFTEVGYENPYVVYELNGEEFTVSDYEVVSGKYVFDFADIAPNNMNDTVKATLYATFDGVEYVSETREYSVATYCYNMLNKYTTAEYAELQTLLVDLLNYGAMSQIYTSYKTDDLVNAHLTDAQKAWGTAETPTYETVQNVAYKTIDNPTVTWKGGGLNLVDAVTMRFKISADSASYENLEVKVETDDRIWTIPYEEFSETTGGYYVYFSGLNAGEMSEPVYLTVYENDEAVSNTLSYSIESYAYSKQNSTDTNLVNLLEAMMKYGNSAYVYAN